MTQTQVASDKIDYSRLPLIHADLYMDKFEVAYRKNPHDSANFAELGVARLALRAAEMLNLDASTQAARLQRLTQQYGLAMEGLAHRILHEM